MVDGDKLSKPLIQDGRIDLSRGHIAHNDIIGRETTPFFTRSSKGRLFRIEQPTLSQYLTLTPRIVTPVSQITRPSSVKREKICHGELTMDD